MQASPRHIHFGGACIIPVALWCVWYVGTRALVSLPLHATAPRCQRRCQRRCHTYDYCSHGRPAPSPAARSASPRRTSPRRCNIAHGWTRSEGRRALSVKCNSNLTCTNSQTCATLRNNTQEAVKVAITHTELTSRLPHVPGWYSCLSHGHTSRALAPLSTCG